MKSHMGAEQEELMTKEFCEFMIESSAPPKECAIRVQDEIERKMKPVFLLVFSELLKIQTVSGAFTLLVCPQFGVGPVGGGEGLMEWVQPYGHVACGFFCGAVFVILNVLFTRFLFSLDERNQIRANPVLPYAVLGSLSFGVLLLVSLMWNGEVPHLHSEFVMAWFAAFVGLPLAALRRGFRFRITE